MPSQFISGRLSYSASFSEAPPRLKDQLPASPSVSHLAQAIKAHYLRTEFQRLMEEWKRDTALESSTTDIAMHPAYQQIIGMGSGAIPLILEQLQTEPDHWLWALKAIARCDPVPPGTKGFQARVNAWLDWGRARGHVAY